MYGERKGYFQRRVSSESPRNFGIPRYKSLAEKWIAGQGRLSVRMDFAGNWGIWDASAGNFALTDRWTDKKSAQEFLAVSIVLGTA